MAATKIILPLGLAASGVVAAAVLALTGPADAGTTPPAQNGTAVSDPVDTSFTPTPGAPAPSTAPLQVNYTSNDPRAPVDDRPVPGFTPTPGLPPSTVAIAPTPAGTTGERR